jgi:DNA-binding HxlR family transcriptional regulator
VPVERCPEYHQAVELIGRRWMGAILYALMRGPHRFHEFERMIPGISHRLLTERLRELEAYGIVIRRVIATSPVKVEYELTEAGLDLQEAVRAIMNWGTKWLSPGAVKKIDGKPESLW